MKDTKSRGGKIKNIGRSLSEVFDIPPETTMNIPKITIIGNLLVEIENHRGIVEYSAEKARVGVSGGEVEIRGKELVLSNIFPEFINIRGTITAVDLRW